MKISTMGQSPHHGVTALGTSKQETSAVLICRLNQSLFHAFPLFFAIIQAYSLSVVEAALRAFFGEDFAYGKPMPAVLLTAMVLTGCLHPAMLLGATTISYVQGNYATPQTSQTTVTVPFTAAQAAGDLNVVVVGWNDSTATVSTVTDKSGNTYLLAVGPTIQSG
ncbi:MAG TPA: hypothetical protein VGY31_09150, partial [Terriglobia bacterium]|nr:hypothetical protein [Terriglobia bacterium]